MVTAEAGEASPVGQAVAITYASSNQEPGKITVAVTGYNLQNQVAPGVAGVSSIEGRLQYDGAVLEIERTETGVTVGNFISQGDVPVRCCRSNGPAVPGLYSFFVGRSGPRVQGSGELFLARFRPQPGVISTTTRIVLMPFNASEAVLNPGARFNFMTSLLMEPFAPAPQAARNMMDNVYGATITIRPGG